MTIKEQVKALWHLCFDDHEEFIEMYFNLRYNNEVNVTIESGNEVISALQMIPYPMTFCGQEVPIAYISGACTYPDFRGKGVMRELLLQSFARMLKNDVLFSTLIPAEPWLFDYYARNGYAPIFRYIDNPIRVSSLKANTGSNVVIEQTTDYEEDAYNYLASELAERPCSIQHTSSDFKVILEDLALTGDAMFIARSNKQVVGVAIAYRNETHTSINELVAENEEVKQELFHQIRKTNQSETLSLHLPIDEKNNGQLHGMARIINARKVLDMYAAAHPEETLNIELTDEQLSTNNGFYYLYKGKCRTNDQKLPGTHLRLNIAELTEKILSPMKPFMSLMLD